MCAFSIKTFNPGPSQLSPQIVTAIQDIAISGFLSQSHRGSAFIEVSKEAIDGLRDKMRIPLDFHILYQSSSTMAIDTLLRNLVFKKSYHFFHGAFSGLFFKMAQGIGLEAAVYESLWDEAVPWEKALISDDVELIAVTHNETSTGLIWPLRDLLKIKQRYPSPLLAVDVTSSFGTLAMDWTLADVWFGSVQKCLGLPAGLGFLIISPRAFEKAKSLLQKKGGVAPWQRLDKLVEMMQDFQTPETPNMLNIALLARQMRSWNLDIIERELLSKARLLFESDLPWIPYVKNPEWRSPIVANFRVDSPLDWQEKAKKRNMLLGKGYGSLENSCIRIANFPVHSQQDINGLLEALS